MFGLFDSYSDSNEADRESGGRATALGPTHALIQTNQIACEMFGCPDASFCSGSWSDSNESDRVSDFCAAYFGLTHDPTQMSQTACGMVWRHMLV